ncbi:MAG: hypothetical protein PVJ05_06785 [Candidatus Thorarchaeota archaeon]|jgi:hypothetical protein
MGKRLILGTKPEVDPLQQLSESKGTITTGTEIRWEERGVGLPLGRLLFVSMVTIVIGLYIPVMATIAAIIFLSAHLVSPKLRGTKEMNSLLQEWQEVPEGDISCLVDSEWLELRGVGGTRHSIGLDLGKASPNLLGNVGSLVRALDTSSGFCLSVSMKPDKITRAMDGENISDKLEGYLISLSKGDLDAYVRTRGGIWISHTTIVGHIRESIQADSFDSAVRAAVPEKEWKRFKPRELCRRMKQHQIVSQSGWFFAAGSELSEWLVQLRSELAAEVGSNIPGQFIAPIRGRPDDYRLGVTLNPDTLQTGPPAGISHLELTSGTLVCGGTENSRNHVLALLVAELLRAEKRVIVVTGSSSLSRLTGLTESSVFLELGKDLVLNPVDSEGISRNEYVPLLISALQVVAAQDLRGAAELEIAVSRAVSLGNATLADVRLNPEIDDPNLVSSDSQGTHELRPSKKSLKGMEAIRSLHMGPAARAFYGTQTVPIRRLADPSLSIIKTSLGSTGLDSFAWNLICMKLAGLQPDPNLVIILDGAENMRIRNRRFMKHDSFSERLLKNLKKRGPVVLALEHPADMAPGAIAVLASCVSLRIRESVDIKIVADLLGLNVMTTGMHTKARISPRESSYLRIMDDQTALLIHDGTETCQPIQLEEKPELVRSDSVMEMSQRIDKLVPSETPDMQSHDRTLLDMVAAGSTDLAIRVLKLLERYEPLTEEAVRRFVVANGTDSDPDIEGVIARLEHASMILRGHESHSGVSYSNFRITMKGSMALRQAEEVVGASG